MFSFVLERGRVVEVSIDGIPHRLKIVGLGNKEVEVAFLRADDPRGVGVVLTERAARLLQSEYTTVKEWRFDLLVIEERQAGNISTLEADVDDLVVW